MDPRQKKTARNLIRKVFSPIKAFQIFEDAFGEIETLSDVLRDLGESDDSIAGVLKYVERGRKISEKNFALEELKDEPGPPDWMRQDDGSFTAPSLELFKVGEWNGMKITHKMLAAIVEDTNEIHDKLKPFIKLGHDESKQLRESAPAMGWIGKLFLVGDTIRAAVTDIPAHLAKAVRLKRYKRGSIELMGNFKEPSTGKRLRAVIRAFAFLGADIPGVTTLADIANFETAGLSLETYEFALGSSKPEDDENKKKEVKKMAEVTIDTAELEELRARAKRTDVAETAKKDRDEELVKTYAQMKTRKIGSAWGEVNGSGRATPAEEDSFKQTCETLDDTTIRTFKMGDKELKTTALDNFIDGWKARPVSKEFKQKSDESRDEDKIKDKKEAWEEADPKDQILVYAMSTQKEGENIGDALIRASLEKPKLKEGYDEHYGLAVPPDEVR